MRNPDFVIVIQNALRDGLNLDAAELQRWVALEAKHHNLLAPLVVYSFDSFETAVGVSEKNWITKDFGELLERILKELRDWHPPDIEIDRLCSETFLKIEHPQPWS